MKAFVYIVRNLLGGIAGVLSWGLATSLLTIIVGFVARIPIIGTLVYAGHKGFDLITYVILPAAFFAGLMVSNAISKSTKGGFTLGTLLYSLYFGFWSFIQCFGLFYDGGFEFSYLIYSIFALGCFIAGMVSAFSGEI